MTTSKFPSSNQSEENGLIIGIDATNLRQGGGRTHLIELLRAATPQGSHMAFPSGLKNGF